MTAAKEEILGRIRQALGDRSAVRAADYQAIARTYRQSGSLDPDACLDLFISRIQHYDGGVYRCDERALPETIARVLASRHKRRLIVPGDFPHEWLPEGFDFIPDVNLSYSDLDRSDGVVTGCTVAIALTGTIVLLHAPAEGRRALTLIPDYHACIVRADQIVETVPEGIRRAHSLPHGLITTISGPSATADIEMIRIKGVHGPRTLDVILVVP